MDMDSDMDMDMDMDMAGSRTNFEAIASCRRSQDDDDDDISTGDRGRRLLHVNAARELGMPIGRDALETF